MQNLRKALFFTNKILLILQNKVNKVYKGTGKQRKGAENVVYDRHRSVKTEYADH